MSNDAQRPLFPDDRTQSLTRRANKLSRKAHKKRYSLPVLVPHSGFNAIAGVPPTRAECPTQRPCPNVRCKYHLAMEDAEHRAGRPGLGSVPRDSRGLTISQPGNAGPERSGTTLRPIWLELDRTCRVNLYWDEAGRVYEVEPVVPVTSRGEPIYTFRKRRIGTWDMVEDRLHPGERLEVYDDGEQLIASAFYMPDGSLCFDRNVYATSVTLLRVRETASCALDEIDKRGKHTNEQTGDAVGRHRTLVARELRKAMEKAKAAAAGMGMSEGDLLRGLRELGAG